MWPSILGTLAQVIRDDFEGQGLQCGFGRRARPT
jgi:hypothetical protein